MKTYSVFLFDADGTILDTTELIVHCFKATTQRFKKTLVSDEDIKRYIGLPFVTQCEKYFGKMRAEEIYEIREFHREYQLSVFKDYMSLFQGTKKLFQYLKETHRKVGIVTSRSRPTLDIYLDYFKLTPYIDVIVTPEDVEKPKPDSESCFLALNRLNGDPSAALFVGDAVFDESCASGAKVDFALVGWTHQERKLFKNVKIEIGSFEEFIEQLQFQGDK